MWVLGVLLVPGLAFGAGKPRGPVTKDGKQPATPGDVQATDGAPKPEPTAANREEALSKAKAAADAGDPAALAKALRSLRIFSNLNERNDSLLRAGVEHLESGALARAEKTFRSVTGTEAADEMAELGRQGARTARLQAEADALEKVAEASDPRAAARILVAGYEADPESANARKGFRQLKARIEGRFAEMEEGELAHAIEALSILENVEGDMSQRIAKASGILAEGRAAEAEAAYRDAKVGVLGDAESQVAAWAVDWVRKRRIAALEQELAQVSKAKDVIAEDRVVQALLALDPDHREAKRRARTLRSRVVAARLASAREHQDNGQYGPAFIYLKKGLDTAPGHEELGAELEAVKAKLEERRDLILVVPALEPVEGCAGFAEQLRTEAQQTTSRRDDLGAYVLSPGWTKAWKNDDPRAPHVEGALRLEVVSCRAAAAEGAAQVRWSVQVPLDGDVRGEVAGGELTVSVDSSLVPKDEQDAQGRGTMRQLSDRVASAVADAVASRRDDVDQWLLVLGQTLRQREQPARAAHAYARLVLNKPLMVDDEQMEALGSALSQTYR
jgi:hypothetical protein